MKQYSGKFLLRLDKNLHRRLVEEAKHQNISLNQLVLSKILSDGITRRPESIFLNDLIQKLNVDAVVEYGSYVRGEANESSDIDWLIILPKNQKIIRQTYREVQAIQEKYTSNEYVKKISIHLMHAPENFEELSNFWLEVGLEGKILIDNANFSSVLTEIKNLISRGKYLRKLSGGQPYWINYAK